MSFMYPVGFPLWRFLARHGVTILVRMDVQHDREAAVFVLTSPQLQGLVVEVPDSASAEDFHREVNGCVDMLMQELLHQAPKVRPVTAVSGDFALA